MSFIRATSDSSQSWDCNDRAIRLRGILPSSIAFLSDCATGLFESGHLEAMAFTGRNERGGIGVGHSPAGALVTGSDPGMMRG